MKTIHLPLLCALAFAATGAIANDTELLRCGGMADATARLACYDALTRSVRDGKATVAKPAPAVTAPSATTAVTAPAALPKQTTQQFGLEQRATKEELDSINSEIVGPFDSWQANTRITLANGQVWQIADGSGRYISLKSQKVRIRRGLLGAFYIEFDGTNHSPRVRRVQ